MLELILIVVVGYICYNQGKKAHIKELEKKEFEEFKKRKSEEERVMKDELDRLRLEKIKSEKSKKN